MASDSAFTCDPLVVAAPEGHDHQASVTASFSVPSSRTLTVADQARVIEQLDKTLRQEKIGSIVERSTFWMDTANSEGGVNWTVKTCVFLDQSLLRRNVRHRHLHSNRPSTLGNPNTGMDAMQAGLSAIEYYTHIAIAALAG